MTLAENRGFAGAIRADQTDRLAGLDGETHLVGSNEPAKSFDQIADFELRTHVLPPQAGDVLSDKLPHPFRLNHVEHKREASINHIAFGPRQPWP